MHPVRIPRVRHIRGSGEPIGQEAPFPHRQAEPRPQIHRSLQRSYAHPRVLRHVTPGCILHPGGHRRDARIREPSQTDQTERGGGRGDAGSRGDSEGPQVQILIRRVRDPVRFDPGFLVHIHETIRYQMHRAGRPSCGIRRGCLHPIRTGRDAAGQGIRSGNILFQVQWRMAEHDPRTDREHSMSDEWESGRNNLAFDFE